uniref:Putative secreted protein n=1 Tax=Anopheles darlingi TaxID=43151 RepID=A0A2M4DH73_ANODA
MASTRSLLSCVSWACLRSTRSNSASISGPIWLTSASNCSISSVSWDGSSGSASCIRCNNRSIFSSLISTVCNFWCAGESLSLVPPSASLGSSEN